jgi:hypothetical protein
MGGLVHKFIGCLKYLLGNMGFTMSIDILSKYLLSLWICFDLQFVGSTFKCIHACYLGRCLFAVSNVFPSFVQC